MTKFKEEFEDDEVVAEFHSEEEPEQVALPSPKPSRNIKKTESIAEFLARGGKITRVASPEPTTKPESIKSTTASGPAVFLSLGEAELFYGERKAKKAKKAKAPAIDLSALPEELRKKYVDGVMNGNSDEEEDEEDGE